MGHTQSVICIGELLIDFFCTDINVDLVNGTHFLKQAGGAPANVSAAIARLGGHAKFVGKVGDDSFGYFLKGTLDEVNVDTSMLVMDSSSPTTLAFVSLQAGGERDFTFHRGADGFLKWDELDLPNILQSKIIHFGSATAMLEGATQDTYFRLMALAKENGLFISFDPNYRELLWNGNTERFIQLVKKAVPFANFVKVSEGELAIITGANDLEAGVKILHQYGAKWVAVTLGKDGTFVSVGEQSAVVPSVPVKSIDSTGAGDAFVGATLFQLSQLGAPSQAIADLEKIKEMTSFSNKVGALVCTKVGAISSLPTYEDVVNHR